MEIKFRMTSTMELRNEVLDWFFEKWYISALIRGSLVDHQEGQKKAWKRRLIIDNYAINQFINVVTFQVE